MTSQLDHGPTVPRRVQLGFQLHLPVIHGAAEPAQADPFLLESELYRLIRSHPEQQRDRLEWDSDLQRVARLRVADMRDRQYIAHTNPDGDGPNMVLLANGVAIPAWYDHARDANNVESLRLGPDDAADALAAFVASPHHRAHILGENDFWQGQKRIGIGCGPDWNTPTQQWIFVIISLHPA